MVPEAQTFYEIGRRLYDEGKYGDSLEALRAAVRSNPGYVEAYNTLGNCYLALSRSERGPGDDELTDHAAEAFDHALRLDPSFWKAASNLALLRMARGEVDAAVAACDQALSAKPDCHEAFYIRGSARLAKSEYTGSIADFEHALSTRTDDPQSLLGLAAALYLGGQATDAAEVYTKLAYSSPELTSARLGFPKVDRALDLMELGAYESMPSVRDEDLAAQQVLFDLADEVRSGKVSFDAAAADAAKAGKVRFVTSGCLVKLAQSNELIGKENPDAVFLVSMLGFQAAKGAGRSFIANWILRSIGNTALEAGRFDFAAGTFERCARGFRELGHDDFAREAKANRDKARDAGRRGASR